MNTTSVSTLPAGAQPKALWTAIGVLGAAVVGLGGALAYQSLREPAAPAPVVAVAPTPAAQVPSAPYDGPEGTAKPARPVKPAEKVSTPAPASPAVAAAQTLPAPHAASVPAPVKVCKTCATVESVHAVERTPAGTGVGAVAGGVVGAVVGNQIGGGSGKAIATVLGAVGGGMAGNAIEKNLKKTTVYQISVRMDDGSVQMLERAAPVAVGAKVTLEGGTLRTSDGAVVPAVEAPKPTAPVHDTSGRAP